MKKLALGALVVGLSFGSGYAFHAHDAQAAQGEAPAMQLARLVATKELYLGVQKQMVHAMLEGMRAQGQQVPAEVENKLGKIMLEVLPYEEMLQISAKAYGSRFSAKELGDVIAFYKTPTGSKLVKALPDITAQVSTEVQAVVPGRLQAALKKHGLK